MPRRMTIAGQIEQLIESLEGAATCDDCITDRLNLSVRSQANAVTRDLGDDKRFDRGKAPSGLCGRSEEHTSELQSLMRISDAVFRLTKKIMLKNTQKTHTHHIK